MEAEPPGRVLSGMRPTGELHIGHYACVLTNWVRMQEVHECFFFVADWHALTTSAGIGESLASHARSMVTAWLAAGIDPDRAVIYVQSKLREPAELSLMLSMVCPLPWAERVPTFREYEETRTRDEISCGLLAYPILQAADIIMHAADYVPVGEDQLPHIEFAREIARRFNALFGKDEGWEAKSDAAAAALDAPADFDAMCRSYRDSGDEDARGRAFQAIRAADLGREQQQRLFGRIDGGGRAILKPPQGLVGPTPKMPGLDGRKMSKSYGNDIGMLEPRTSFEPRLLRMPTDPARVRRNDPGDPAKCPVWPLHRIFSDEDQQQWASSGCRSAAIGCRDCKAALAGSIEKAIAPMRERAEPWQADPAQVDRVIAQGNEKARASAALTLADARAAAGLPPA